MKEEKTKTRAQMIIDGDIEPENPRERGLLNLRKRVPFNQMPEDKVREIRRKGAEAVNKLHGEKKTAKQSIERILTLKVDDNIIAGPTPMLNPPLLVPLPDKQVNINDFIKQFITQI